MASEKLKRDLNQIVGWVNAFQTLIDRNQLSRLSDFGMNTSITNWLANGGQLTQTIDIIQLIYLLIGDRDWETFLMEMFTTFATPQWLETVDDVVKKSLIGILASLLSCDINPIIPDKLIMAGDCDPYSSKRSDGEGYTIPLSVIDMMGSLFLSPTDKVGKYNYFDVRNPDKIYLEYDEKAAIDYVLARYKIVSRTKKDENGEKIKDEGNKKVKEYIFAKKLDSDGSSKWGEKNVTEKEKIEGQLQPEDIVYYHKSNRNRLYVQKKLEKKLVIESNDAFKVITVQSIKDENGAWRVINYQLEDGSSIESTSNLFDDKNKVKDDTVLYLLNNYGVLFADVPDTLWKEKAGIDVNTLWQSHDFNAFLWYVINRGIPNNDDEKRKCIWDNRYSAYRKITKGSDRDVSLHRINSLGDAFYDAKTDCEVLEYNGGGENSVKDIEITLYLEKTSLYTYQDENGKQQYTTTKPEKNYDTIDTRGNDDVDIDGTKLGFRKDGYDSFIDQINKGIQGNDKDKYVNLKVNIKSYRLNNGALEEFTLSSSPYTFKYKIQEDSWANWDDVVTYGKEINDGAYRLPDNLGKLSKINLFAQPFGYNQAARPKPKKKQLAYFEYAPGNGLLDGGIRVLIPPLEYYRKHSFKMGDSNVGINEFMLVWDYEFIDSIQLFDPQVAIARLIDLLFNATKPIISINYSQIVLNEMIKHIVDGIIEMDDTKIDDCYFTFSNDDFNQMLIKAERARRGFATNGYSYIASDLLNDDRIQGIQSGDMTVIPNTMRNIVPTGKDNKWEGGYEIKKFWDQFLHKLVYFFVEIFFSPKVMMVLAINMEFLGMDIHSIQSWDNMLTVLMKGVRDAVIKIKDAIINWLLSYITTELTKLTEQVMSILAMEQLRTYWDILTNLINLVKKYFKIHGPLGVNDVIENVAFADIAKPTQEISTDANNNKC